MGWGVALHHWAEYSDRLGTVNGGSREAGSEYVGSWSSKKQTPELEFQEISVGETPVGVKGEDRLGRESLVGLTPIGGGGDWVPEPHLHWLLPEGWEPGG